MNLATRTRSVFVTLIAVALCATAFAEGTRTWEQSKFEDLTKGTTDGVAIRSRGGLELAPAFKALSTTPSSYIWSIAADAKGNVYAAAGAPARIYRITPDGQSSVIFEPQELQVQALLLAKNGVIYAATNPDGKIYRVEPRPAANVSAKEPASSSWSSTIYFDPHTKYIWDLAMDNAGNLFVATGDHGEIYRVTPKGEHSVFFKSDEPHIRVLAFDQKGDLIAGSDGSGLIYRISPAGQGFVLYSAPKKEITALAVDPKGNIYAAGIGEKRGGSRPPFAIPSVLPQAPAPVAGNQPGLTLSTGGNVATPVIPAFSSPVVSPAGSEIYRIAPDGSPMRMWSSHDDLVYALAFDQQGHLLAGTGNRGHIFSIDGEDDFTDLLKASATQITAFAKAPSGGLYASTSNLGKIFLLGGSSQPQGSYESDVFDAHIFSRWGRAEFRGAGDVDVFARSGNVDNPDRNWSDWQRVDLARGGQISVPAARFIQWKAVLRTGTVNPKLDSVVLYYLPKNVAPDFDDVSVQLGTRYQSLPKAPGVDAAALANAPPLQIKDPNSIGVKWAVHDDNDDQMVYSVYYRGDGEARWLLLKDNLPDKFYSFDSSLLPDGGYTVKVVASDAPSHSPDQALTADKESPRFEVDTTPPNIEGLTASATGGKIHVAFRAVDGFSTIKRAEYSVDAGDWQFVEPEGELSDSRAETYSFNAALPFDPPAAVPTQQTPSTGATEHVIVVRVYDRFDNMNSAKFILRGK
jgi:sugar lactone lactonase YvrE